MSLRDTVVGRLVVAIKVLRPDEEMDLTADSKLGDDPPGWDTHVIKNDFLELLSRDETGFTDIVQSNTPLVASDMGEDTSLGALAGKIIAKSATEGVPLTLARYRARTSETIGRALRICIASIAGIPDSAVDLGKQLSEYITDGTELAALHEQLTTALHKYLLSDIDADDLQGRLEDIRHSVLIHMLA
jgi:hypothetical protein